MKSLCAVAALGLSLVASVGSTLAQPYGAPGYGYPDRDYRYEERGPRYRDRDYRYEEPGPRYQERYEERRPRSRDGGYAFNEREYLRCHPDVRRAVRRGELSSGTEHYLIYGRSEGRRLRC
jgi:hypothetical protein